MPVRVRPPAPSTAPPLLRLATGLLLLLTFAAPVSPSAAPAQVAIEQVVVTATQRSEAAGDLPLAVSVIRQSDLERVRHTHINEAFQWVAGGWISRGNGQESLTALRSPVLTGSGGCGAFFMAGDGISLRAPGFCNVNQLFDANTEQASRVEVVKGPATSLYGSGAMHGLINIITPRPGPAGEGRLGLEAGPHGYRRAAYRGSGRSRGREQRQNRESHPYPPGQGVLLAFNVAEDGGYKDSSGFQQGKLSFRHEYQGPNFALDTIFTAAGLDQETAGFITGYRAYRDNGRKKTNPNPEAYRKSAAGRLQSSLSAQLPGAGEIVLTPYWRRTQMEFLQHFLPWQPVEKNGQQSVGLKALWRGETLRTRFTGGADVDATEGYLQETQAAPFSPNLPVGVHYDYRVDALTAAAFAQAEWDLARNWQAHTGLRYERSEYDYDNRSGDGPACGPEAEACRFHRPADREDAFADLSGNLALIWDYQPQHRAYLRFSRGFRAPQAAELYRLQSGQAASLDSESLSSSELGLKGSAGSFGYELAAYRMEKRGVIFQDAERRNVSGAATSHRGLEASLRWHFAGHWELTLDGTLARHEYASEINLPGVHGNIKGNIIDTAPEHFGSVRLARDFRPGGRFLIQAPIQVEAEWVRMGGYFLEPSNRYRYGGHDVLNLRLSGKLGRGLHRGLHWGLRLTNLLDVHYAERADFGFGQYRYFVGESRGLYGNLEYRWGGQSP